MNLLTRRLGVIGLLVVTALGVAPAAAKSPPGAPSCPVFPADNAWHSDISRLPVHPRSAAWISSMGGTGRRLHPDFGPSGEEMPYGIPYTTVASSHAKVSVDFTYADESDAGPYPLGPETPIESGSDAHAIMIDRDTCTLYELYGAEYSPSGSTAGSGAIWNLRSNALRPAGWTSADAAGLPIFAGLVRLDEVKAGLVDHAIRVTASRTDRSYVWPARHQAGAANDTNLPPMGARFRLKAGFGITGFRADTQTVLRAMKKYGVIVADNGSDWFFTGSAENGWSTDMLDELKTVPAGAFQAVDASSLMISSSSGRARRPASSAPPATTAAPKPKPPATQPARASATPSATPAPSANVSATTPIATPTPGTTGHARAPVAAAEGARSANLWWLLAAAAAVAGAGLVARQRKARRKA